MNKIRILFDSVGTVISTLGYKIFHIFPFILRYFAIYILVHNIFLKELMAKITTNPKQ